jgi:hypothetical protein
MRSIYVGKAAAGIHSGIGDHVDDEQNVVLERVLKSWSEERKTLLRKYKDSVMSLERRSDGINDWLIKKGQTPPEEMRKIEGEFNARCKDANDMLKALVADYADRMVKAGVTVGTGYVGYRLDGPAYLVFPVNTPLRNEIARVGTPAGKMTGTMVHWKYGTIGPSSGSGSYLYGGAAEGKRVGISAPNEVDGVAQYSVLGVERSITFEAEFGGEGYTDNVADEHIRGYMQLILGEEAEIWGGNQGASANQNGFALGTANTPSTALSATIPTGAPSDGSSAGFSNSTSVAVYVVELTMLGYPNNGQFGYQTAPAVGATGLVPSYSRADAGPYTDTDTINGGMGHISAASNVSLGITSTPYIKASVVAKKGAIAWAWFVDDQDATTPATANAFLAAITTVPYCYFGANSKDSAISGNQAANSAGLNTDKSAQPLDFSGILAWAVTNGVWNNMSDITALDASTGGTNDGLLDPITVAGNKTAAIAQLDYDLKNQFTSFQTVGDEIWCDPVAKLAINQAIMAGGAQAFRFETSRDGQGNILGGAVVTGYKSIYGMKANGADEIRLRLHPMLPVGTYVIRKTQNPYPQSRIPAVSAMAVQREFYAMEWPMNRRAWEFGEYVHETYIDYIPGLLTVRTGIQGVSTT